MGDRNDGPDEAELKDLRTALQHAVCKIVLQQDRVLKTRTSPAAINALTELTFQYITRAMVPDLYAFSTHGNRKSSISPDDVALLLRKLPSNIMEQFRADFCNSNTSITNNSKKARRYSNQNNGEKRKQSRQQSPPMEDTTSRPVVTTKPRKRGLSLTMSPSSEDSDLLPKHRSSKLSKQRTKSGKHPTDIKTTLSKNQSSERPAALSKRSASKNHKHSIVSLKSMFQLGDDDDDDDGGDDDDHSSIGVDVPPKQSKAATAENASTFGPAGTRTKNTSNLFARVSNANPSKIQQKLLDRRAEDRFSSASSDDDHFFALKNCRSGTGSKRNSRSNGILSSEMSTTKSQVQEALDNQPSDSGMDEVDEDEHDDEDENEFYYGKPVAAKSNLRGPVIDDDAGNDDGNESDHF
ncbi:CENP-S protein [Nitzschia inconspicua]|uniref:CENP-S protein n=1 Tax=Nitzschia inconspicua TaxID=303405 RepID=A0A9K3LQ33_9STRA|nr:CENP-S protein [Nitzschia inconspicua]